MAKVLGFAGSLRQASYNRALLSLAQKLSPQGLEIEIYDLKDIPIYNMDLEEQGLLQSVIDFKQKIEQADGLLIVTPEHNYSVPGVLKNAIDWATRPSGQDSLTKKPAGIIGASTGPFGTVRAQEHLRQILQHSEVYVMPQPQILIAYAGKKFDESGNLIDPETTEKLKKFLESFKVWVERFSK